MGLFSKLLGEGRDSSPEKKQTDEIRIAFEDRTKGIPHAAKRIAEEIRIDSMGLARQFVLEELDAARQGNEYAVNFVKNSGFSPSEYIGAMKQTKWGDDNNKLEHLQCAMRSHVQKCILVTDIDSMCKLQTAIVDEVMQAWKLGKYSDEV